MPAILPVRFRRDPHAETRPHVRSIPSWLAPLLACLVAAAMAGKAATVAAQPADTAALLEQMQGLVDGLQPGTADSPQASAPQSGGALFQGDVRELGGDRASAEVIYRFRNQKGRTVYTNIQDEVPEDQLQGAAMDLSSIPLNSEIGTEIDQRLEQEHERLVESDYCDEALSQAEAGPFELLWERYSIIVVFGGLLLLLFLVTPFVLRRVDAPRWARTLSSTIPMVAFLGLLSFTTVTANKTMSTARRKATPCKKSTWNELKTARNPIGQHAQLIRDLQKQIRALEPLVTERGM